MREWERGRGESGERGWKRKRGKGNFLACPGRKELERTGVLFSTNFLILFGYVYGVCVLFDVFQVIACGYIFFF